MTIYEAEVFYMGYEIFVLSDLVIPFNLSSDGIFDSDLLNTSILN